MHQSFTHSLSFLIAAATLAACQNHAPEPSTLRFGYLADSEANWLVGRPSGTTLKVCGSEVETLAQMIQTWAGQVGLSFGFADCDSGDDNDVYSYSTAQATRLGWCDGLQGRGFAYTSSRPMAVVNCGAWNDGQRFLLHEAGHLFGLCDQYPEAIRSCGGTTTPTSGSVMYSADSYTLTPDDVAGIEYLGKAFGLNAAGSAYLVDGGASSVGGGTGGASNSGPVRDPAPAGMPAGSGLPVPDAD